MARRLLSVGVLLCSCYMTVGAQSRDAAPIVVASKPFGESYLLAEMFAQILEADGIAVRRIQGLGSTEIVFAAVRAGSVDVYPEYTGTGLTAVLHDTLAPDLLADARAVFSHVATASASRYGVRWLPPLGFENTFAVAVRSETAAQYQLRTLSDLARESGHLTAGLTADFIDRPDGLAGLQRAYGIRPSSVKPLLPALKYQVLASGGVDIIDGFSTDGLLERYRLTVLVDDRHFFPPYEAAAVLGSRAAARGDVVSTLTKLSGRISETTMRSLNRRIEVEGEDPAAVAASALRALGLSASTAETGAVRRDGEPTLWAYMWARRSSILQRTFDHVRLSALALMAAVLVAVPTGLALERARIVAGPVLSALGVVQTIPSIALLAFMVPLLGVGAVPALIALWLYALLPIAQGAYIGVRDADPEAVEAAEALGMTPFQRLLKVRLPLAAPVIMAGIRTAAVITIGATTLAAFIGAGGLGEPIVAGLALADTRMVLSGALPAAALAVLVDRLLAILERLLRPAHLRRELGPAL